MEDKQIIQLYWDRNQDAIAATSAKYGNYCTAIARNILENPEDAEECVNDTYLNAWNAMPPHRPNVLAVFLGRITRNLSFNRYKQNHAQKRGGGELPLILDELAGCVSGSDMEQEMERKALVEAINAYLENLPTAKKSLFLCRYWYADSVSVIAKRFGMTENHVSVILSRLRSGLKTYLLERGFAL